MDELLAVVVAAEAGSAELDRDIVIAFGLHKECPWWLDRWRELSPRKPSQSMDDAVALLRRILPGWWWTAGDCELTHDASVAPAGSSLIGPGHAFSAAVGPDFRAGVEAQRILDANPIFDGGFDVARMRGTVPLAIVEATIRGKMALDKYGPDAPHTKMTPDPFLDRGQVEA